MKSGVKFADGKPLTASDVKYTFDTIMNPASAAVSATYFASVASVAAPDPTTVVVHMKHPDASFPAGLTTIETGIVPTGATATAPRPSRTGPARTSS